MTEQNKMCLSQMLLLSMQFQQYRNDFFNTAQHQL